MPIDTSYPTHYPPSTTYGGSQAYGAPQTYPSPYEPTRAMGVQGDLEGGATPVAEGGIGGVQKDYRQSGVPESQPLASGVHGEEVYEMGSRRDLR